MEISIFIIKLKKHSQMGVRKLKTYRAFAELRVLKKEPEQQKFTGWLILLISLCT